MNSIRNQKYIRIVQIDPCVLTATHEVFTLILPLCRGKIELHILVSPLNKRWLYVVVKRKISTSRPWAIQL